MLKDVVTLSERATDFAMGISQQIAMSVPYASWLKVRADRLERVMEKQWNP